jgi:hypothetical protein
MFFRIYSLLCEPYEIATLRWSLSNRWPFLLEQMVHMAKFFLQGVNEMHLQIVSPDVNTSTTTKGRGKTSGSKIRNFAEKWRGTLCVW